MLPIRSMLLTLAFINAALLTGDVTRGQSRELFAQVLTTGEDDQCSKWAGIWSAAQYQAIREADSSDELIEWLGKLIQDGKLPTSSNPAAELVGVTWIPSGWRWEELVDNQRVILAVEDDHLFAMRVNRRGHIDMSIGALRLPLSPAQSLPIRTVQPVKRIQAMSETHLSRVAPEAHQLYAFFAGPSRTIVRSAALSTPSWANLTRGAQSR